MIVFFFFLFPATWLLGLYLCPSFLYNVFLASFDLLRILMQLKQFHSSTGIHCRQADLSGAPLSKHLQSYKYTFNAKQIVLCVYTFLIFSIGLLVIEGTPRPCIYALESLHTNYCGADFKGRNTQLVVHFFNITGHE